MFSNTVNTIPITTREETLLLKHLLAPAVSPSPSLNDALGDPPSPIRFAKACTMIVIGNTIPNAARASVLIPSIPDTNILSTTL